MTEKWNPITYADLIQSLSQDEIERLDTLSLSADVENICQQQLNSCADAFRYAWQSKGYNIDEREHYIPNGYKVFILNYARPYIWTRFPNCKDIAMDEIRMKLYEEAKELLKDPYIGVPEPDYGDDPSKSSKQDDVALTIPQQRIISQYAQFGFPEAYKRDYK